MTYTEKSLIYDKIRNVPAIYWRVSNKEGERQYLNEQDEQIEPEESAELLRNTLESLTGTVFVQIATRDARTIADSKDFQTGIWKYNVKCIRMPEFQKPNVSNGVTLDRFLDVYNQLHAANMEVFRLKMKIDNIEADKGGALDSILETFKNKPQETIAAIGSIKNMFLNPKPATIQKPENDFSTWNESEQITSVLERLRKLDSQYVETLTILATAAEKNPELLPYFKNAIKEHV
jgi:hypothetical protein